MATTYYIWKWAKNDLPGKPSDIVARLCSGELPPTLQPFSPADTLGRLDDVADQRRTEMSDMFIETKEPVGGRTAFICVCDHAQKSEWLRDKLLGAVWPDGLTLYDESANRLEGLPKLNVVELPDHGKQLVDVERADIPALLATLSDSPYLNAFACYDRHGNMFQVWAEGERFAVEWQVVPARNFRLHQIWVAGRLEQAKRRTRLGSRPDLFNNEILGMADAQRLWEAFLGSAERPDDYLWRDITHDLPKEGNPPREHHQTKVERPPP